MPTRPVEKRERGVYVGGYERDCDVMPKEGNLLTLFSRTIAVTGTSQQWRSRLSLLVPQESKQRSLCC